MVKLLGGFLIACLLAGPALSEPDQKYMRLGTDPAADAPPALDLTYLDVGRSGKALEIRIGIEGMLPAIGGYPDLPGVEWIFDVGGRTFLAEAVATTSGPAFYLFELTEQGFVQLESPTGTYDHADGFARIVVPLKTIGARKGSKISGADVDPGDVDAHVHAGGTYYADSFVTTKSYIVR